MNQQAWVLAAAYLRRVAGGLEMSPIVKCLPNKTNVGTVFS